MWQHLVRVGIAATAWFGAVFFMVLASINEKHLVLAGWGILFGIKAALFTAWQILVCEKHRVEAIAAVAAQAAVEHLTLRSVP